MDVVGSVEVLDQQDDEYWFVGIVVVIVVGIEVDGPVGDDDEDHVEHVAVEC